MKEPTGGRSGAYRLPPHPTQDDAARDLQERIASMSLAALLTFSERRRFDRGKSLESGSRCLPHKKSDDQCGPRADCHRFVRANRDLALVRAVSDDRHRRILRQNSRRGTLTRSVNFLTSINTHLAHGVGANCFHLNSLGNARARHKNKLFTLRVFFLLLTGHRWSQRIGRCDSDCNETHDGNAERQF